MHDYDYDYNYEDTARAMRDMTRVRIVADYDADFDSDTGPNFCDICTDAIDRSEDLPKSRVSFPTRGDFCSLNYDICQYCWHYSNCLQAESDEIFRLLGGMSHLIAGGAKDFECGVNGDGQYVHKQYFVSLRIKRDAGINKVQITHDRPMAHPQAEGLHSMKYDTYTVYFIASTKKQDVVRSYVEDISADELRHVFESRGDGRNKKPLRL